MVGMEEYTGETAESLVQAASEAGHRVSPVMLKKWRDAGLMPRPSQRSRGRGRGTATIYPPGTTAQLLRLLAIRADRGRFDPERALWRLWWEGWPIEPEQLRAALDAKLIAWDRALRDYATSDVEDGDTAADAFVRAKLPPVLRRARKRAGSQHMPTVATLILDAMAGEAPALWQDEDDASTLFRALGVEPAIRTLAPELHRFMDDMAGTLHRFGQAVSPEVLHDALHSASDKELVTARDDLRKIVAVTQGIWNVAAFLFPKSNAGRDVLALAPDEAMDALSGAILCTLALRRYPAYADLLDAVTGHGAITSALTTAIANDSQHETMKPPRRRQPSGGTASSVRSTQCTTSLASPLAPPALDTASSH
ncbi:MAG: hypothetical protein H0T72_02185 [Chloroflexia bacterium]|nr:hypothetical protein [Chloroflexia bacterium]